ncbi:MAG: D-alanine--D-alanine ligase [Oscillospiraceae bacterium]|nr:D-alanine--D-alanine ligase [Oscillospiraceae bacterium]
MYIVVLCGGLYPERDVSISSGRQIAASLIGQGHQVLLMDLFFGYPTVCGDLRDVFDNCLDRVPSTLGTTAPDLGAVRAQRSGDDTGPIGPNILALCKAADIVFMALHGEDGENGKLQSVFDMHGIRYTGTGPLGSAMAMHKGVSRMVFACAGIQVPPGQVVRGGGAVADVCYPCVVKPASGGSSVATTIVREQAEMADALAQVFQIEPEALVETFIPGREFAVAVLDNKPLPVIEICPGDEFYDYENKYQAGRAEEICPAELSPADTRRMQEAAMLAHQVLRLEVYSRTDFILTPEGDLYCLESNTLPGMTPTSLLPQEAKAAGIDFGALCETIIAVSMEKYV